jgi:hypothetical protein
MDLQLEVIVSRLMPLSLALSFFAGFFLLHGELKKNSLTSVPYPIVHLDTALLLFAELPE